MRKMIDLFPTPFLIRREAIGPEFVSRLQARAIASTKEDNVRTDLLSHTAMVSPEREPLFEELTQRIIDEIGFYGEQLLGDSFRWTIKEMWMNVLEPGGSQFMHTHANSLISGIIYLSELHPTARTIFSKSPGANEFIFKHDAADGKSNKYNAERWMAPDMKPGDLVLYPSYLLHGVPPNQGGQRVSLAFNAIPDRLKSFGYEIGFSP